LARRMEGNNAAICDSVRMNISLMFRGVVPYATMLSSGVAGTRLLSHTARHHEANGMEAAFIFPNQGRRGVDDDMLKKIRDHVMNPVLGFIVS
jgi:hypothetical protein